MVRTRGTESRNREIDRAGSSAVLSDATRSPPVFPPADPDVGRASRPPHVSNPASPSSNKGLALINGAPRRRPENNPTTSRPAHRDRPPYPSVPTHTPPPPAPRETTHLKTPHPITVTPGADPPAVRATPADPPPPSANPRPAPPARKARRETARSSMTLQDSPPHPSGLTNDDGPPCRSSILVRRPPASRPPPPSEKNPRTRAPVRVGKW